MLASSFTLVGQNLSHNLRSSRHEELVLVRVNPLLEIVQRFSLSALDLLGHDGLAPVNLCNHVVHHDARSVVLEFPLLKVLICSFDRSGTIILACTHHSY